MSDLQGVSNSSRSRRHASDRLMVLAYDDDEVLAVAEQWATAGLVSTFYAVDLRQVHGAVEDHAWSAVRVDESGVSGAYPLTSHVADANPEGTVVVALRGISSAEGEAAAMTNLHTHLHARVVGKDTGVDWVDLVFPWQEDRSRPLSTNQGVDHFWLPEPVPHYRVVVISPEDSKAPTEADIGVTSHHDALTGGTVTLPRIGAQNALAIGGVLGGSWAGRALDPEADLAAPSVVRSHVRAVAGGRDCYARTARFVVEDLFTSSIADVDARGFRWARTSEAMQLSDEFTRHIRNEYRATAAYDRPRLDLWFAAPAVSIWRHIWRVLYFIPRALGLGFGKGRAPRSGKSGALESEDLGYTIRTWNPSTPTPPLSPRDWRSWPAIDEKYRSLARQKLAESHVHPEGQPSGLWREVTGNVTGLCDGSEPTFKLSGSMDSGRRLICRTDSVAEPLEEALIAQQAVVDHAVTGSLSDPPDHDAIRVHRILADEFGGLEPVRPSVVEHACWLLPSAGLEEESAAVVGSPGAGQEVDASSLGASQVTHTASVLMDRELKERSTWSDLARQLAPGGNQSDRIGLLGLLRARSISDLLASSLDLNRWSDTATAATEIDTQKLLKDIRPRIRRTQMVLVAAPLLALTWWLGGEIATGFINSVLSWNLSPSSLGWTLAAVWVMVFLSAVTAAYRVFAAEAERAGRLVERRLRALAGALLAAPQRDHLRLGDAVVAQWSEILSHSLTCPPSGIELTSRLSDAMQVPRPAAMQVCEPNLSRNDEKDLREILRREAVEPGWRLTWLQDMVAATSVLEESVMSAELPVGEQNDALLPLFDCDAIGNTSLRQVRDAIAGDGPNLATQVGLSRVETLSDMLARAFYSRGETPVKAPKLTGASEEESTVGDWLVRLEKSGYLRHILKTAGTHTAKDNPRSVLTGSPASVLSRRREETDGGSGEKHDGFALLSRASGLTTVLVRLDSQRVQPERLKVRAHTPEDPGNDDVINIGIIG